MCLEGDGEIVQSATAIISSLASGTAQGIVVHSVYIYLYSSTHFIFIAYNTDVADYVPIVSQLLTFIPGGDRVVCTATNIVDDNIIEGAESFPVTIDSVSPTPGVVIGFLDTTTVYIQDSESKCYISMV